MFLENLSTKILVKLTENSILQVVLPAMRQLLKESFKKTPSKATVQVKFLYVSKCETSSFCYSELDLASLKHSNGGIFEKKFMLELVLSMSFGKNLA